MNEAAAPIVAPTAPGWSGGRWRAWVAVVVIMLTGLVSIVRSLQEPSAGYRFRLEADDRIVAHPLRSGLPRLDDVRAVAGGGQRIVLSPDLMVETGGLLNRYDDQTRFYKEHARIHAALESGELQVQHAGGVAVLRVDDKPLSALGLRFWFPWFLGLLSLSVGLLLWVHSPQRGAAWCYLLSSAGFTFIMLLIAPSSSRLLTQSPVGWQAQHMASHAAAFLQNGALCVLLWNHPTRLGGRWFGAALAAWAAAWLVVDWGELVQTISIGFRLPAALFGPLFALLFVLQWRAARGDPVKRAQLKWLTLLFAAGFSAVFVAYVYGATGAPVTVPQAYGLAWIALIYIGLVPVVSQVGLFRLESWWVRAWLWFLGGLVVVALDVVFMGLLSMQAQGALLVAFALGGWVYFPLRQWLWRRMGPTARAPTRDLLPDIVSLASQGLADPVSARRDWLALWDRVFAPQHTEVLEQTVADARVQEDGRVLLVPGGEGLPSLRLTLAERGARLFSAADLRRCDEISRLALLGLRTQAAVEAGVRQERARIASDLHDDLGATLLTIAQGSDRSPEGQRVAGLARQAMQQMRLSVRGLTSEATPADEVLADWRAETVSRLEAGGLQVQWLADDAPAGLLVPARTHVQLTRVLREAVSNVIRHSAAARCRVQARLTPAEVTLQVDDDGCGLGDSVPERGVGLAGIERRARLLGGRHSIGPGDLGGVCVRVSVPLGDGGAAGRPRESGA